MSRSWSRQSLWICWVIAVVRIQEQLHIIGASDVFPSAEYDYSICWRDVGGVAVSATPSLTETSYLRLVTRGREIQYVVSKTAIFVCPLFQSK